MGAAPPLVSVVIPCHKQGHLVSRAIESALAQTAGRVEVVLVDDGSPDDTGKVAASFGDRIRYVRQANAGLAGARNGGIAAATGDLFVFVDADDALHPRFVEQSLAALDARPGAGISCAGWNAVDPSGKVLVEHAPVEWAGDVFHQLLKGNPAPPCCWLLRRSVLEQVGVFRADKIYGHEDWDMWLRVARAGVPFATAHGAPSVYLSYPGSMTGNFIRMYFARMEIFRRLRADGHPGCATCRRSIRRAAFGSRMHLAYDLTRKTFRSRSFRELGSAADDVGRLLCQEPLYPLTMVSTAAALACRRVLRGSAPPP